MNPAENGPKPKKSNDPPAADVSQPAGTPASDAITESNPTDSRLDEKVIVNTQGENKIVNAPSQTGVHPEEGGSVDEL